MRDYRRLIIWQKSHQFVLMTYKLTSAFPKEEMYGLTSQMRRSAMSIPTNIAEGCGRNSAAELARYLEISLGSASELDYQLLLARDLDYIDNEKYDNLSQQLNEIKKMMRTYAQSLRTPGVSQQTRHLVSES